MVMQNGSKVDSNVLFIDASKEYVKVTNNNKLSTENLANIMKIFTERKDVNHVAKLVSYDKLRGEEYNLSVSTYVEP